MTKILTAIDWNVCSRGGTSFREYLTSPFSFEETIGRLITVSGQDPTFQTDECKVSVEFIGRFEDHIFTLYDYKGDHELHIGGTDALNVAKLHTALIAALRGVTPSPYTAIVRYDELDGQSHGWPITTKTKTNDIDPRVLTFVREFLGDCGLPFVAHQYALAEMVQATLTDYCEEHTDPRTGPDPD